MTTETSPTPTTIVPFRKKAPHTPETVVIGDDRSSARTRCMFLRKVESIWQIHAITHESSGFIEYEDAFIPTGNFAAAKTKAFQLDQAQHDLNETDRQDARLAAELDVKSGRPPRIFLADGRAERSRRWLRSYASKYGEALEGAAGDFYRCGDIT